MSHMTIIIWAGVVLLPNMVRFSKLDILIFVLFVRLLVTVDISVHGTSLEEPLFCTVNKIKFFA